VELYIWIRFLVPAVRQKWMRCHTKRKLRNAKAEPVAKSKVKHGMLVGSNIGAETLPRNLTA